ncbi:MAG: 30S ribosomal protein S4 [Clostridiales bacterium]|jgi:small subunit ribosomal protein S4|nr:30S ribosomal protein S4 [Clostridiales bacterium]
MARYTDAVCKLCRREGQKLFLKGDRCYTGKCSIVRREAAPGQHGQSRKKKSEYLLQLREKQKTKRYYGMLEKQFAEYYEMAARKQGVTGENLLQLLESRFDNIIYRLGFAMSRPEARQLLRHGHFTINGKKVNIPSYLCRAGDVITLKETSKSSDKLKSVIEANASKPIPKWLDLDRNTLTGRIINLPAREDIDLPVEEHLIVELYSK